MSSITAIATTFLVAMLPVLELRGAIPVGVGMGLSPILATIISIFGNLAPIPFILLLLQKIFDWLRDKPPTKKFIAWLETRADQKRDVVDKYGYLGLMILVAIPLPGTGAWTGALVASALKMRKKPAFLAITAGVFTAGIIVFLITYGAVSLF